MVLNELSQTYIDPKRFLKDVYGIFRKLKIIRSQNQFSTKVLKRSPNYFSMVMASNQNFSTSALSELVSYINQLKHHLDTYPNIYHSNIYKDIERLKMKGIRILNENIKRTDITGGELEVFFAEDTGALV